MTDIHHPGRISTSSGLRARVLEPTQQGVAEAARLLREGGLVAFATETVYGLGADATSPHAVAKIYAAKGRPAFNPLIAHVPDLAAARREGAFSRDAEKLAAAFWPGPLTLVVPVASSAMVCELARAGLDTIALRVPAHRIAHSLLEAFGRPVAAPSANRSGRVSPVTAGHVLEDLGDQIDAVLDCGAAPVGVESTIVACGEGAPVLLRPGGVAREDIERIVGPLGSAICDRIAAPGMMSSHYAPRARVRVDARALEPDEVGLDFGGQFASGERRVVLDLSPTGDTVEAAGNLYDYLRRLDRCATAGIAVAAIPFNGLGEAINDRLSRAAAPRAN